MSGHADTIRDWLISYGYKCITDEQGERHTIPQGNEESLSALDALVTTIQQQADRIAWLEGDVAGWRIKLAECIEDAGRYCDALERIAAWPVIAENPRLAAAVRAALDGTPSELAEREASR